MDPSGWTEQGFCSAGVGPYGTRSQPFTAWQASPNSGSPVPSAQRVVPSPPSPEASGCSDDGLEQSQARSETPSGWSPAPSPLQVPDTTASPLRPGLFRPGSPPPQASLTLLPIHRSAVGACGPANGAPHLAVSLWGSLPLQRSQLNEVVFPSQFVRGATPESSASPISGGMQELRAGLSQVSDSMSLLVLSDQQQSRWQPKTQHSARLNCERCCINGCHDMSCGLLRWAEISTMALHPVRQAGPVGEDPEVEAHQELFLFERAAGRATKVTQWTNPRPTAGQPTSVTASIVKAPASFHNPCKMKKAFRPPFMVRVAATCTGRMSMECRASCYLLTKQQVERPFLSPSDGCGSYLRSDFHAIAVWPTGGRWGILEPGIQMCTAQRSWWKAMFWNVFSTLMGLNSKPSPRATAPVAANSASSAWPVLAVR